MSKDQLNINELLYYNKPSIGGNNEVTNEILPKELIYPNGKIQIGINVTNIDGNDSSEPRDDNVVVASGPEKFDADYNIKDNLMIIVICLGLLNIIITSCMYHNLDIIDMSAVMKSQGNENVYQSYHLVDRSPNEFVTGNYVLIQFMNILCILSAIFYSTVGLTIYSLSVVLNFIINISNQPSFVYTLRFVFDSLIVYIALVLRSTLTYNYIVLQNNNNATE